jgi:periplasmic divalent cation tolerance protein
MRDTLLVYMTAPDRQTARALAGALVRERLAAGANILPGAESLYWWQGEVRQAEECACVLKTTAAGYAALEKRARELHPYQVPCIVALPVARGHDAFLRWIGEETLSGDPGSGAMPEQAP